MDSKKNLKMETFDSDFIVFKSESHGSEEEPNVDPLDHKCNKNNHNMETCDCDFFECKSEPFVSEEETNIDTLLPRSLFYAKKEKSGYLIPGDGEESESEIGPDDVEDQPDIEFEDLEDPTYEVDELAKSKDDYEEQPLTLKRKPKGCPTKLVLQREEDSDVDDQEPTTSKRKRGRYPARLILRVDEESDADVDRPSEETPGPSSASRWTKTDINNEEVPTQDMFGTPTHIAASIEYFFTVFPNHILEHITYQTNLYAKQESVSGYFPTTKDEIMQFIGILLYMGVCLLPSLDDYWAKHTRIPQVANVMSSKRFRILRRTIHFNDNACSSGTLDRFYKIRPLYTYLTDACLAIPSTVRQSIDEVMVGYKGTQAGNLRQYIQTKPDKWGFKLYCRASDDGFIHDIIMYQGQTTFPSHHVKLPEDQASLPVSCQLILTLCNSIRHQGTSIIYADNFFSSIQCVQELSKLYGYRYTGTARENRVGNPPLMSVKEMNSTKVKRGYFDYRSSDDIIVIRWKDNKPVTLISNDKGVNPIKKVRRFCKETRTKEEVECPAVVAEYNAHMGGIDKSDMLVHMYRTPMKSKRWYLRLFGYLLDLAVVNAWLLYKRDCKALEKTAMSLKMFRLEISFFCTGYKPTVGRELRTQHEAATPVMYLPPNVRGQRSVMPADAVRFDLSLGHFPIVVERQSCKHCSKKGHALKTQFACNICKLHLCLKKQANCFVEFHRP